MSDNEDNIFDDENSFEVDTDEESARHTTKKKQTKITIQPDNDDSDFEDDEPIKQPKTKFNEDNSEMSKPMEIDSELPRLDVGEETNIDQKGKIGDNPRPKKK